MRAPKRIYWLEVLTDENSVGLGYRQKGGGKFTDLKAAKARQEQLARPIKNWNAYANGEPEFYDGLKSKIYVSQELEWTEYEQ